MAEQSVCVAITPEVAGVRIGHGFPIQINGSTQDGTFLAPSYPASATLSALRVVTLNSSNQWVYADKDTSGHINTAIALLTTAVNSGSSVRPVLQGLVADSSWSWSLDTLLWLGANGLLTQTPPTTGFLRQLATIVSPTQINFNPQEGISL
ncbi:MAG: hypothetical protein AAF215_05185 [Cyanobacteria bacterium P01_A01_bin.123]